MISCTTDIINSCPNDFEDIFLWGQWNEHKCISINTGRNSTGHWIGIKQQTKPNNVNFGIHLKIASSYKNLYYVFIHDYPAKAFYSSPTLSISNQEIKVIRLDRIENIELPEPYSNCKTYQEIEALSKENRLIQKTIEYNGVYTLKSCQFVCFFKYMSEKNGNHSFPGVYETDQVGVSNVSSKDLFRERIGFDYMNGCSECPQECNIARYEMEVLETDYSAFNDSYASTLELNTFEMYFYYEEIAYTKITQIPLITSASLFSKIGGLLGLFIGFRILGFIDILQFFIELVYLVTGFERNI